MGTKRALVPREQNRGINSSPRPLNNTIKRGESSRQKGGIFCEKAIENHNRIVEKALSKNSKKVVKYLPVS